MKKLVIILVTAAVCVFGVRAFCESNPALEFLSGYGWECGSEPIEKADIIIPAPFDLVYERYNALQLEAGLDLRPYAGKRCTRYTYTVINYPENVGEEVRANVIVCGGKCIGGDICTVSLGGFMHSLCFPDAKTCFFVDELALIP